MKSLLENWRRYITEADELTCPPATQDLELNTKNRDSAIQAEHIQYGPLNLDDEDYWVRAAEHWNTKPEVAKKSRCGNCVAFDVSPRMLECLPGPVSEPIEDAEGKLGYCWMHHFKCHSARTCYTWAAGGAITEDDKSAAWQEKNKSSLQEEDEQYGAGRIKKKKEHAKELGVDLEEKKKKKKEDRCTRIAKRKYDVWPSAYASGAVVRCRQGKIWKGVKEGVENLEDKIRKALKDEGGAAGMKALEDHTEATAKEIKAAIEGMKDVGLHKDGDYILDDKKQVDVKKNIEEMVYEAVNEFFMNEKKKKTDYSKEKESGLHGWFSRAGGKGKSKGWVDCNTCRKDKKTGKKTCKSCGRQKGEKRAKYPSCRPTPSDCGTKGKGKKWGKRK